MFGKKKDADKEVPPAPANTGSIKQNIGEVTRNGAMDVGIDMGNVPAPPRPAGGAQMLPPPPNAYDQEMPEEREKPPHKAVHSMPRAQPKTQGPRSMLAEQGGSPPLFIKIDKYRELIQSIKDMKSHALSLRDAMDALSDIEKELRNGINITHMALDRFNNVVATLDSKLMKVGAEEDVVEVPQEMDEYVKDLYDHVERIKHELRTISQ